MNWDDLRIVLAVQRAGTHTRAARDLGIAHTTVSRRLKAAEADLGVRLFDRTPEGLVATSAGQEILELAERVEGEVLTVERRVTGQDRHLEGPLCVSTLEVLLIACRDAFGGFVDAHPAIDLTLTTGNEPVSLGRREADVALRMTSKPSEGLVGRRVGRMRFQAFASPTLADRVGRDAPAGEYPWLGFDERMNARWLDGLLAAHAPGARIVLRIDESTLAIRQLIDAGVGAFFLPEWEGRARGWVPVGSRVDDYAMDIWLLTHPDLRKTARVRAFMDYMGDALPALPVWMDN